MHPIWPVSQRNALWVEAASAVAAAKAASASLVAELETAQKVLQQAEHRVSEAAATIIHEDAIKQAAALRQAWNVVWQLTDVLNALRGVPTSLPLPPDAVHLLHLIAGFDHRQFPGGRNVALGRAGERWRVWHQRLCEDPNAPRPDDGASSAVVERVA